MKYPINIALLKEETRNDAEIPQEKKYPSGTIISKGYMWKHTLPEVGSAFFVYTNKTFPIFITSTVVEVLEKKRRKYKI